MTPDTTLDPASATATVAASTAGMTTKVVKGSIWTLVGQVAPMAVTLVTTPFVIRLLGVEGYGVIALVGLIPVYLSFADLGMGFASTKFGSQAYGAGDRIEEARVVRTATVIALAAAVPIAAVIFIFSGYLPPILNVPDRLQADSTLAFRFAAVSLVFYLLNNIVNTPQLARLRMDLNTFVTAGARILGTAAVPLVVYAGGGAAGAIGALMVANILMFAGHVFMSGRLNSQLFDLSIDRRVIRPLLAFGGALAVSSIAVALVANAERLILTAQTSIEQLAYYSIAFTLANAVTLFGVSMSQSSIPAFTQLLGPDNRVELERLYARILRMSIFSLLPIIAVLFVIARPFFSIWAGPNFARESTIPFYILLCALFLNLNAYVPSALILASGRSDILAKLFGIELVPYILAAIALTGTNGAVGAAAAWSIRSIADALAFFWLAKRICGVGINLGQSWGRGIALSGIFLPPIVLAVFFSGAGNLLSGSALILSLMIYAVVLWTYILQDEEKLWLNKRISQILGQRAGFADS